MSTVLAFDVGGTHCRGALVDGDGVLIGRGARPTPVGDGQGLRTAIAELGRELIAAAPAGRAPRAAGVAIAGTIDRRAGLVRCSPNAGLTDFLLAEPLRSALGLPVLLVNDVNAAALGEARARGVDDLAVLFLGTGVGAGFVNDGQLLQGARGMAGEGGHLIHDPAGEACPAGCVGCFEAHLGGAALGRAAEMAGVGSSAAELLAAWRAGQCAAEPAVTRALSAVAALVTLVVNTFDPALIVLGGGLGEAFPEALAVARNAVAVNPLGSGRREIPVEAPVLGQDAGLLGAGALARASLSSRG